MNYNAPNDFGYEPEELPDNDRELVLAETILAVVKLGRELRNGSATAPVAKQYQLAVAAEHFRESSLLFPAGLYGALDDQEVTMAIVTYNFASDADRPYCELRLETDNNVVANIAKPGLGADVAYSCSIGIGDTDYSVPLSTDDVADLFSQIVVPSLVENETITDPQYPPQSRNIIDTLIESQHADVIESQFLEFTVPETADYHDSRFKVEIHSINNESQEIQIELVTDDEMSFDMVTGEPQHNYRSIMGTFIFDVDDFYQSVKFTKIVGGQEPQDVANDTKLLKLFQGEVNNLYNYLHKEPGEILIADTSEFEQFDTSYHDQTDLE